MTTINTKRSYCTHFEDLSNEIIYEIFDFLDMYHVYEACSDLNVRFQNLVHCSSLPLNINMSFLSKSNFRRYYIQFVLPNVDRISSIRLWNSFMFDLVFSSSENIEKFIGLKTLVLDNIIFQQDLLHRLISLPNLSSLIINHSDCAPMGNINCNSIICLPKLKYCKISCKETISFQSSYDTLDESSSLEHLAINNEYDVNELPELVSHFPHLRRLSINYLHRSLGRRIKPFPEILNKLTHVVLTLQHITFDLSEPFIINLFRHVQVFRISTNDDIGYLNANRWERIISSYMISLRIFDIQHSYSIRNDHDQLTYEDLIKQFTSSFWVKRQWYFEHQYSEEINPKYAMFYSIEPYRRRDYVLCGKHNETCHVTGSYQLVRHVHIQSRSAIRDCSIFFPNTDELTISFDYYRSRCSRTSILGQVVPLEGIHKIIINSNRFHFVALVQILSSTPNCSQLILNSLLLGNVDPWSIRRNATFRSVSNTNKTTDITVKSISSWQQVSLLIQLCPQVQHLILKMLAEKSISIIQCLLATSNKNTHHLMSLHIQSMEDIYDEKLMNLLELLKRSNEFAVQEIHYTNYHIWC